MNNKRYERTEDGTPTIVSVHQALAEVNTAMMEGKREVRTMSSGKGRHDITYKDGRHVVLIEVDDDYPRVQVKDAPGYADFTGALLLAPTGDWAQMAVVGYEWKGKREFAVIPAQCVILLESGV